MTHVRVSLSLSRWYLPHVLISRSRRPESCSCCCLSTLSRPLTRSLSVCSRVTLTWLHLSRAFASLLLGSGDDTAKLILKNTKLIKVIGIWHIIEVYYNKGTSQSQGEMLGGHYSLTARNWCGMSPAAYIRYTSQWQSITFCSNHFITTK